MASFRRFGSPQAIFISLPAFYFFVMFSQRPPVRGNHTVKSPLIPEDIFQQFFIFRCITAINNVIGRHNRPWFCSFDHILKCFQIDLWLPASDTLESLCLRSVSLLFRGKMFYGRCHSLGLDSFYHSSRQHNRLTADLRNNIQNFVRTKDFCEYSMPVSARQQYYFPLPLFRRLPQPGIPHSGFQVAASRSTKARLCRGHTALRCDSKSRRSVCRHHSSVCHTPTCCPSQMCWQLLYLAVPPADAPPLHLSSEPEILLPSFCLLPLQKKV